MSQYEDNLIPDLGIQHIDPLPNGTPDEDIAAMMVGRYIRKWFIDNPYAQALILQRDSAGIPRLCYGATGKTLAKTFEKHWSK